jgi:demethylmenaquinone methyltransferase/2-methoxy-6-polyprenyl-1,4-benzoquinol methylase
MPQYSGNDKANFVKDLFKRLAGRYDLANHWMTWGQDEKWRDEVISSAKLPQNGKLLDIGTGSGELALKAIQRDASVFVVGVDFTQEMMRVGQLRDMANHITWVNSDAHTLPFSSGSFDTVVSGYLLRNVIDLEKTLKEQYRVLKPGGRMVSLDTTPPPKDFWHVPVWIYLRWIIPIIGGLVTGDFKAYRYLPASTDQFLMASSLGERMQSVGFNEVGFRTFMGNSMAIHWGVK